MEWFIGICGVVGLGASIWYAIYGKPLNKPVESNGQHMLFMSEALDVNWDLTRALGSKMDLRSLEIAKADGRFLVTPDDMRKAYEEIIREEHM